MLEFGNRNTPNPIVTVYRHLSNNLLMLFYHENAKKLSRDLRLVNWVAPIMDNKGIFTHHQKGDGT